MKIGAHDSTEEYVNFYLRKLRNHEIESAFHGLTEVGHSVIPRLVEAFHEEREPEVRAELVRIVWSHRRIETVGFLREAMNDSHAVVWKAALDGLVTFASLPALQVLRAALNRSFASKAEENYFHKWVEEAIEQVHQGMLANSLGSGGNNSD